MNVFVAGEYCTIEPCVIPHRVQSVLLVQELGNVLSCRCQHALVLQVLHTSLRLLVEARGRKEEQINARLL